MGLFSFSQPNMRSMMLRSRGPEGLVNGKPSDSWQSPLQATPGCGMADLLIRLVGRVDL